MPVRKSEALVIERRCATGTHLKKLPHWNSIRDHLRAQHGALMHMYFGDISMSNMKWCVLYLDNEPVSIAGACMNYEGNSPYVVAYTLRKHTFSGFCTMCMERLLEFAGATSEVLCWSPVIKKIVKKLGYQGTLVSWDSWHLAENRTKRRFFFPLN